MSNYDAANFHPPAPVAEVELRNSHTGTSVIGIKLVIDSGADATLIPRHALSQIGVIEDASDQVELVGFDGSRSMAAAVTLDVVFQARIYRGRYLVTDEQCGIMGRDVLNHVKMLLDGPQESWSILK